MAGHIVASGNILNMYDYLGTLPSDNFLLKAYPVDLLIYPPGIFLFHGLFTFIFQPFVPLEVINNFLVDYPKVLGDFRLNLHLLLLKIPYMIVDLPAAFFLSKLFVNYKDRLMAFTFWIFNPLTLYGAYMMGQFDILPTFFVILSLYLVSKDKQIGGLSNIDWAAVALGVGAIFKIYPLYLLIPLAALQSNWNHRIRTVFLGVLPYLLIILPFLPSRGYRSSALFAGQIFKSFYAQLPISGGESIIIFLASIIFIYLLFLQIRIGKHELWQNFFIIIILFLMLTHYHPQWFLWVTPFLIIDLVKNNFKNFLPTLLSFGSFFGLLFFFDPSLTLGLFSPIWHNLYNSGGVFSLFNLHPDYNLLRSFFQTILVGSGIYFIYRYFPKNQSS
ncbi:MAG: hypothetical protein M1426_04545 [Patescibacteria group bacterium]|nr:hypothetical protein [Patescibacteria group bacterium]